MEDVEHLPDRDSTEPEEIERRRQGVKHLKHQPWRLCLKYPEVRAGFDKTLHLFNGTRGDPESFNSLGFLLADQVYRLGFWKLAAEEINYRRFFDVSDLVGLRVEDPHVFAARHVQILQLIAESRVTGFRVDHIDGLRDPQGYLERLQAAAREQEKGKGRGKEFFVIVEKILADRETLPAEWPACGTTGYDFLNLLNGIFVSPDGFAALREAYGRLTGHRESYHEITYRSKKKVMEDLFAGEINIYAHALGRLAAQDRRARDVPLSELRYALIELTACLPVYRTYIRQSEIAKSDRSYIEQALNEASERTPAFRAGPPAFDFLRSVLVPASLEAEADKEEARLDFVMLWQQFTGAVTAKGVEDTALYLYNPMVSVNEVGGDPGGPATLLEDFHRVMKFRQERMACTLNATSTHDTKRSEDVRARINVLSEIPSQWERCVQRWHKWNQVHKQVIEGMPAPDLNDELLIYQTLVGIWPFQAEEVPLLSDRLKDYMVKSVREAKAHTDWIHPNAGYEDAVSRFVESLFRQSGDNKFLKDFLRFHQTVSLFGALNSLSQMLIKITSPGIPDLYQGTELWDFSVVDPDNRRPVDFKLRLEALEDSRRKAHEDLPGLLRELLVRWQDGRVKFFVADKALDFRKALPDLFRDGQYLPIEAGGSRREHVCAFARRLGRVWSLVVAPRWASRLAPPTKFPLGRDAWKGTTLILPKAAPRTWVNILTEEKCSAVPGPRGHALPVRNILKSFPVALLVGPLSLRGKLRV
jgi:(1->4)-alpha-D-glucan 1-alpha-D-glucosylmutase